jgi:protein-L-isoaspartate(D-aspartate) O-methyltransferase
MVNDLVRRRVIRTPAVERAFRCVPRHAFLPSPYLLCTDPLLVEVEETDDPCRVYNDVAVALGAGTSVTCCTPSTTAAQVEQLSAVDGMRVLQVGTGSGYCSAILAEIVGECGTVVGVDYTADIAELGAGLLAQAGYTTVTIRHGDGVLGVPEAAPFDRILVTAGVTDIAPAWVRQLGEEGKLVLPLCPAGPLAPRVSGGTLLTIQKSGDTLWGTFSTVALFVPLQSTLAPVAEDSEALADGLARWLALENFLRSALPIRLMLKPTSTPTPDPSSVPWMLETKNAVMWIEPS